MYVHCPICWHCQHLCVLVACIQAFLLCQLAEALVIVIYLVLHVLGARQMFLLLECQPGLEALMPAKPYVLIAKVNAAVAMPVHESAH